MGKDVDRRNFLKYSLGAVCGIAAVATLPPKTKVAKNNRWVFYINGKEIDSSRAVDEYGTLHWPFQGAKKGDLCTAKSPTVLIKDSVSSNNDGFRFVGITG